MRQLLFLASLFVMVCQGLVAQEFYSTKGAPFPAFKNLDLNRAEVTNHSLKGKPTLLVFFGTTCPPCMKELKELDKRLPDS